MKRVITENRNENTRDIDLVSSLEIVQKINKEDEIITKAINRELKNIAMAVDIISKQFLKGGRLFYFGAGTSGRLGVLDASECPPTFGVEPDMVQGIIAGGDRALRFAIEGAEDNFELGLSDGKKLNKNDVCVLISASGNPDYLLGVTKSAIDRKCKIIALTSNPKGEILDKADVRICVEVGAEAIAGSSRMKSGTAQKMVLNMLSTASMVKIGKTYENLMIDVKPTNEKLKNRAIQIVVDLTGKKKVAALEALKMCNWSVKTAVYALSKNVSPDVAQQILNKNGGILRKALE